jgi:hypothetical protein
VHPVSATPRSIVELRPTHPAQAETASARLSEAARGRMHDTEAKVEPSRTAAAIVEMVTANKLGLVVVAGANPLATGMVAAHLMG